MRVTPLVAALLAALLLAVPAAAHDGDPGEEAPLLRLFGQPELAEPPAVEEQQEEEQPAGDFGFEDDFGRGADEQQQEEERGFDVPPATPQGPCLPGSDPEPDLQGRVPPGDPGRGDGYRCNTELVSTYDGNGVQLSGTAGGYKALRYTDERGRECAYYDTTLLFPTNALNLSTDGTGVAVLDMSDPENPVGTATLKTPAMLTPHESLVLNKKRGLLAAVTGNPAFAPSVIDIYDISKDCRTPVLQSSTQMGRFGHESGFAPDGRTFYATSIGTGDVAAVDVTDPKRPRIVWEGRYESHGLTVSDNGTRAYLADSSGLIILDTTKIQNRTVTREEDLPVLATLTWDEMTIPQIAHPVRIGGRPYLVEIDEFAEDGDGGVNADGEKVGAGRIIDISDERNPRVVSALRLEVNQPEHRDTVRNDPGTTSPVQGYAGHYCNIPRREEPEIVACSFIASGLRVFDIRDPENPKEIAYYVAPPSQNASPGEESNYAMSSPEFAPEREEIWYTDGGTGFYVIRLTGDLWPRRDGDEDDDAGDEDAAPPPVATAPVAQQQPSLGLPSARTCVSRRSFPLHVRGVRRNAVRSLAVLVNGEVRARRSGPGLRVPIDLRGLPRGRFTVKVVARTRAGKRIVDTRRYRTCVPRATPAG
jgi:hypothetical protein